MYHIFKQFILIKRLIEEKLGRMAVTSWLRKDGTHETGASFDLAPRSGKGFITKLKGGNPEYFKDEQFKSTILMLAKTIRIECPDVKVIGIENDHLHISFVDIYKDGLFRVVTKDNLGNIDVLLAQ